MAIILVQLRPNCRRRRAALWARIAQNVKKPPLTVNVIHFEFFGFNVPTIKSRAVDRSTIQVWTKGHSTYASKLPFMNVLLLATLR